MLRDITIGQYYPSNSVIHKLDPRVKLFWTLIYYFIVFGTACTYIRGGRNFFTGVHKNIEGSR